MMAGLLNKKDSAALTWSIVAAVVIGVFAWLVLDQTAWRLRWRDGNDGKYIAALGALSTFAAALFTLFAAIGAAIYVKLTYQLWRTSADQVVTQRRTSEAALMQQLMVEYDNLRPSIQALRDWHRRTPGGGEPVETFARGMASPDRSNVARELDDHRFRVSRFFVKIRKLTVASYLPEDIIVAALHRRAIQRFLKYVAPLDAALRKGSTPDPDENFYTSLLERRYQDDEQEGALTSRAADV
jgi:hypothetical protein